MVDLLIKLRAKNRRERAERYNPVARWSIREMPDDELITPRSIPRILPSDASPRIPPLVPDAVLLVLCVVFGSSPRQCPALPRRSGLPGETQLSRVTALHADLPPHPHGSGPRSETGRTRLASGEASQSRTC